MWTDFDEYLLCDGTHYRLFEKLGCNYDGQYTFRVIAPNADTVHVGCNNKQYEMKKVSNKVWEVKIDEDLDGHIYQYIINGGQYYKDDPFAKKSNIPCYEGSVIVKDHKFNFKDGKYIDNRSRNYNKPINIYELHANSFCNENTFLGFSDWLIKYIKKMNYTHVEFLPLSEYPSDSSWGYQVTNYFSITSRFGGEVEFKKLVDKLHKNNIGIIFDWVIVHFANDSYGLKKFDSTNIYEYDNDNDAINELWGTINFDFGSKIVHSFLLSNLVYLYEYYHIDGVRMDAVSNILYYNGGVVLNNDGVEFLKKMNSMIKKIDDSFIVIAEDSSSYKYVTSKNKNSIGFDYKWSLGFMHDVLDYFKLPFEKRVDNFNLLTFSFSYFSDERYLLPFSHDEVVHIKGSIANKMYGDYDQKIAQLRVVYAHMFMHPGKVLNFMGNDIASFNEFKEYEKTDFGILSNLLNYRFNEYFANLGELYLGEQVLHDDNNYKFIMESCIYNILVYCRESNDQIIIVILNTSCNYYYDYNIKVIPGYKYKTIIDSQFECYGGVRKEGYGDIIIADEYIKYDLEPFNAIILKGDKNV